MIEHLSRAWEQAKDHPYFWPALLALVALVFKPKTPEAYARMASRRPVWLWARVAAGLQLLAALVPDLYKAIAKVLYKVITGKADPPDDPPGGGTGGGEIRATRARVEGSSPPSGPSIIGVGCLVGALLCLTQASCRDADYPRESARAIVLTAAKAAHDADIICETAASRQKNTAVLNKCGDAYEEARKALIHAGELLDAYDNAAAGKVPCAVKTAMEKLQILAEAVMRSGDKIPPVVDDAARLADLYTGLCRE